MPQLSPLDRWKEAFFSTLQEHEVSGPLREAAIAGRLGDWTRGLTAAVVSSCRACGWRAAAKGHTLDLLPQTGQEYLGIDVMAFAGGAADAASWQFPLAAFELENSRADDRVAYSLWKVLCLRADLRVVFAYRDDWDAARLLVMALARDVATALPRAYRPEGHGQTVLVIGSRGEGQVFPWAYFKLWALDENSARFIKL